MSESEVTVSEENPNLTIQDSLLNLASGLGTGKDNSMHNEWAHSGRNADHVTLSARYREDWLSQKFISIIPQDMTRDWREFKSDDAKDADAEFDVKSLFKEALTWARLYGTSFIILDVADGRNFDKPINWGKLKAGCLKSMHVVDRTRVVASSDVDQNPMSITFGMPTYYNFVGSKDLIHKDRLIRFEGTILPTYERLRNLWYSDSVLIPFMELFDDFHSTQRHVTQMMGEANVDVVSINGLSEILQNSKTTEAMVGRFQTWKQMKGVFGVSIMDQLETYEQKKLNLSGATDVMWKNLEVVAASVGIPATRFLCSSPTGLGSSGHSDVVNYAESLIEKQLSIFAPRLKVVDKLIEAHYGLPEGSMKYTFKCVFPESKGEAEDRMNVKATSLGILADSGIISRDSALQEAKDAGLISQAATVGADPNAQALNSSANGSTNKTTTKAKSSTGK